MFTISIDSTCDIYFEDIQKYNLQQIPLKFVIEHKGHLTEGIDNFTCYNEYLQFFEALKKGAISKTSQLGFDEHYTHFKAIAASGKKNILHIGLSSGLSPTIQYAQDAAKKLMSEDSSLHIKVIDSLGATIGAGALVYAAIAMRDANASLDEVFTKLKDMVLKIHYGIFVNDLFYLKKGGRVSAVTALAGTLFNIKPVLTFTQDGKLKLIEKCRGRKKVFLYAIAQMKQYAPDEEDRVIRIVHTNAEEDAKELANLIEEEFHFKPDIQIMGPVIGSHFGYGGVGVIWKAKTERAIKE